MNLSQYFVLLEKIWISGKSNTVPLKGSLAMLHKVEKTILTELFWNKFSTYIWNILICFEKRKNWPLK